MPQPVPGTAPRRHGLHGHKFDLLVIGGGATGAGIALDAASRGLTVALLEQHDFSQGTSSRSTKLIHGGVRYLELAVKRLDASQYRLVRSALHERGTMLRLAPHLARPFPLVTPLYRTWELPYYWIGLKAYDLIAGRQRIGSSRALGVNATMERLPLLNRQGLRGAVEYWDGQFDDARMVIGLLRRAEEFGAVVLNHAPVTAVDARNGLARAVVDGQEVEVAASVIINATGPFADAIRQMDDASAEPLLTASSGSHIVLPGNLLPQPVGMLIPRTDDGRVLFLLPWHGHTLVGTTDDPAVATADPRAPEADITYLLDYVNRYLSQTVTRQDVLSSWTGFRPLLRDSGKSTAAITRDHLIHQEPSGLITVTGGKWTTYRLMAEDTVDFAIKRGGLNPSGPCRTTGIKVTGGDGFRPEAAGELGLADDINRHLHTAYGSEAPRVTAYGSTARLHPDHPYIEAEVGFARDFEYARTADDVLERRLRLGFLDRAAAEQVRPRVQELLSVSELV